VRVVLHECILRDTSLVAEQLQRAFDSRILIEQARGVIAAQTGVDMGAAYAKLRSYARQQSAQPRSRRPDDATAGVGHTGAVSERRVMLLDTAALYYRAFYGLPDTLTSPDGVPINAVRGLLDMIARLTTDFRPTEVIACWDDDWRPQWRVDLLPTYKAHRVAEVVEGGSDVELTPDPLTPQVPIIVDALNALGIPIVGQPDYEADDIIGTLATTSSHPVDVVTGDRDLFQVVDDARRVRVIYTAKGMRNLEIVTDDVIHAKYGISPTQYADFAVLRGDASDGLPGVPGIGEKTAASLLASFGSLDGILAAAETGGPRSPMAAGVRMKIKAAADYLTRAPTVVAVARHLDLPAIDARIAIPEAGRAELVRMGERWGLGGSVERVLAALDLDPFRPSGRADE
jgi:5'-3' exonuclease